MKIGILTKSPKSYSVKRLREAAKLRGHEFRTLQVAKFALQIESGKPELIYNGKPLVRPAAVIPRVGSKSSGFKTAVVRQFEQQGVFCLNSSQGISFAGDKLHALQALSRHKVGIPPTSFVFHHADTGAAIERLGAPPVIIKVLSGTQGAGVLLAETTKTAEATVQALQVANQDVLIQKFVSESKGRDVRAVVVGDRVVAAMRRVAGGDEYRSNLHLGGAAEPVELTDEQERTAVLAAKIIGLRFAGVDMLEANDGPQIMEVNASPGLEGIETTTGVDVAGAVIDYLEEQVMFPELDVRQLLSINKGYRVAEISISNKSELVNQTIANSGLGEQGVFVLSISRNALTIPTPKSTEEILAGDRLLCYGKELVLRGLIPSRSKKTRKNANAINP